MKTLIELYDERAIENVLAADVFRPEEVVYLCPEDVAADRVRQEKYAGFFARRGLRPKLTFLPCSLYDAQEIFSTLRNVRATREDCALDVTGGTEAAVFACGMLAAGCGIPAFTYSRRMNRFYSIRNAPFADNLPCGAQYKVEDFFLMAGGRMRPGRVDNQALRRYLGLMEPFFAVYTRHQRQWADAVNWFQAVSPSADTLQTDAPLQIPGDHGRAIRMPRALLEELRDIGMLTGLTLNADETARFAYADGQIRAWLRDVGSVLELYVYKACVDADIFHDVVSSAVVDWDDMRGKACVSNEIDAVAARGALPLFISCKTCAVKTEALNELAILRDRFGGKGAKAAIVTCEPCNAAARHRAAQLGITVIDPEELGHDQLIHRLRVIMKLEEC